jgi:hypothetical protein
VIAIAAPMAQRNYRACNDVRFRSMEIVLPIFDFFRVAEEICLYFDLAPAREL